MLGQALGCHLHWVFRKQTSASKSTTEAEAVALVYSLLSEAFPACELLNMMMGRKVFLRIKEDNTATIKVLKKGYSSKLRHVQ